MLDVLNALSTPSPHTGLFQGATRPLEITISRHAFPLSLRIFEQSLVTNRSSRRDPRKIPKIVKERHADGCRDANVAIWG